VTEVTVSLFRSETDNVHQDVLLPVEERDFWQSLFIWTTFAENISFR
jgi:hypothetical protein